MGDEEVEHPDEQPKKDREPDLDPEEIPATPAGTDLPPQAEVPEDTRGG